MVIARIPIGYNSTPSTNNPTVGNSPKPRAKFSLNELSTYFGIFRATTTRRFTHGANKHKAVKFSHLLYCFIRKFGGFTKITPTVKSATADCIMKHPCVILYPITNYCVKIKVPGSNKKQSVPKQLLKFVSRYIHNYMVHPQLQAILIETKYRNNNDIISYSNCVFLFFFLS